MSESKQESCAWLFNLFTCKGPQIPNQHDLPIEHPIEEKELLEEKAKVPSKSVSSSIKGSVVRIKTAKEQASQTLLLSHVYKPIAVVADQLEDEKSA